MWAVEGAWRRPGAPVSLSFLWCAGAVAYPGRRLQALFKRLGRVGQAWCHRDELGRWIDWRGPTAVEQWIGEDPQVLELLFRPYIHRHWTRTQRLDVAFHHRQAVQVHPASVLAVSDQESIDVVGFGSNLLDARLVVDRPAWMRVEGEMALNLFVGPHRFLTLMCTLAPGEVRDCLLIGAIQGRPDGDTGVSHKAFTKKFHGLRPRDFMMFVARLFARHLDCEAILAISDVEHRGGAATRLRSPRSASYDSIWREYGGEPQDNGFFRLPLHAPLRHPLQVPARKRAMYRRRMELLAKVEADVRALFASGQPRQQIRATDLRSEVIWMPTALAA